MKKTFTTIDIVTIVEELKVLVIGLRVNQIYDIDHKTYLIKLQKPDHKVILLLESASRLHTTDYEWPKNPAPSGFSMKLRKHLRNKRLEKIEQLGVDRVVDLTFGSGEAAEHLIVELYDRGNIILTDGDYVIQNVLRPRKEGEDTRIVVGQKYAVENVRIVRCPPTLDDIAIALRDVKPNTPLKKIFNPILDCGGSVLDHEFIDAGIPAGFKIGHSPGVSPEKIFEATSKAQQRIIDKGCRLHKKGYIIKKQVVRSKPDGSQKSSFLYDEFHPELYNQHRDLPYEEFPSFNKACDEFFSNLESHELDKKAAQKEKEALKKLENVRRDHEKRLQELKGKQEADKLKGQLIELNCDLIESALLVIRNAIANQISWVDIQELLDEAHAVGDPVASAIKSLKLKSNIITMLLCDPYDFDEDDLLLDSDEERADSCPSSPSRPVAVDIHLDESAMANARRYYNMKRQAAKKEQKTIDASFKAIKSAEKKTHQALKEVSSIANINKARKVHWFEKYLWFVSSENYLVIGGKDSQQNEQVVKRHLKPKDVYVHADLHGASSVVIKNTSANAVPPRTLHEAGIMALCNSRAWDEKVVTSAWWVSGSQVSKTAPAGEYLTTGAFMVRGKKNFLPPSHLVYGFGFLFRLEESSISRHADERKVRSFDHEKSPGHTEESRTNEFDTEIDLNDEDESDEANDNCADQNLSVVHEDEESSSVSKKEVEDRDDSNNESNSDSLDDDKKGSAPLSEFPDTELRISHLKGDRFTIKMETQNSVETEGEGEHRKIFLGDDQPVLVAPKPTGKSSKEKGQRKMSQSIRDNYSKDSSEKKEEKALKRGQRGKLKKMQKYKDQDEEDRELVMQILQPGGSRKPTKKEQQKMKKGKGGPKASNKPRPVPATQAQNAKAASEHNDASVAPTPAVDEAGDVEEMDGDEDQNQVPDDLSILNALTAIPLLEDELLYAVPVCAPYTAMTNYKFKVKLTPGTGKKGKACKTALSLFIGDRNSTAREKDLLKAVKDHDLSKNFPGKVKVSAPNMSKIKKG